MIYLVRSPWVLRKLYPTCIWKLPTKENIIYLTFDDGPHPQATPFVLDTLKEYNAKATFFCIGKNVEEYPEIYKRILNEGHRPGNHTHNHLNGWKVSDKEYFDNVLKASQYIDSTLFRPPYGKISGFQVRYLQQLHKKLHVVMWDVLSGDFDLKLTPEACTYNVTRNTKKGSIVVFHDSEKAFPRMREALPKMLEFFTERGFRFEVLAM